MKRLRKYRWPGDVRELQSLIERAVTSAREQVLEIDASLLDEGLPLGFYRLITKLGEGGMGVVYRGRDVETGQWVALKQVRHVETAAVTSLRREIHAMSRIRHPGVVRILEQGTCDGLPWYAMEFLEGETLESRLSAIAAEATGERSHFRTFIPILRVIRV